MLFGIQTALEARSRTGCWLIHYVESVPCRAGCANETTSGPRGLAGRGWGRWGPTERQESGHSVSLWVVTPPFVRGS